jgi:hypothetical protein
MPTYQDWNNNLWLQQLNLFLVVFFTKFDAGGNLKLHLGKRKLEKIRILDLYILKHNSFVV